MSFVEQCVQDSLPIWEECLNSGFLQGMAAGTLDETCFKGYIVDDSLYLREYAKVFAWGMTKAADMETLRTYYSFLSFVNNNEGTTRVQYLDRYGLTDQGIQSLPQRPANRAYTEYMVQACRQGEGAAECMMAVLPCMLSYGWIFQRLLERFPDVRKTRYWPFVQDYAGGYYDSMCREWTAFADKVCADGSGEQKKHYMEIFRTCSLHELCFWQMSERPREDLPAV